MLIKPKDVHLRKQLQVLLFFLLQGRLLDPVLVKRTLLLDLWWAPV